MAAPVPSDFRLRVLVIDDDAKLAAVIAESLTRKGHAVEVANSGKLGAARIEAGEFDMVLTDLRMSDVDGLTIVRKVRECQPDAEVAVISGFNDVRTAQEARKLGAADYLLKPIDLSELRAVVDKCGEKVKLARANRELRAQLDEKFGFEGVIGDGAKMRRVVQLLKAYTAAPAPVLVFGENGTGKELAAKALHTNGPRRVKPFVAMNCAALNENLLDDEMFGHEPGAFTGGDKLRKGRFEHAHGGTLFLDEIGDMPFDLQTRLLRVLSDGQFYRVGGHQPLKSNVRVIAATHQNLEDRVRQGAFREDLFHRLNVIRLRLPSLRERREDIPMLARFFLQKSAKELGVEAKRITDAALARLAGFDFPGNVRQLENICHWLTVMAPAQVVEPKDLPPELSGGNGALVAGAGTGGGFATPMPEVFNAAVSAAAAAAASAGAAAPAGEPTSIPAAWLADLEREARRRLEAGEPDVWEALTRQFEGRLIQTALDVTRGRRIEAAQKLGIGRNTITRKIQELGLDD